MPAFEWTEEAIEQLKTLWEDPAKLSTSEIGRRIGCSKNSVNGKAHRLGLSLRPSSAIMRIGTQPLSRKAVMSRAARASSQAGSKFDSPRLVAVPIQRVREIVAQQKAVARDPFKRCLWTEGIRETGYTCCEELTEAGSSWCPSHKKWATRSVAA